MNNVILGFLAFVVILSFGISESFADTDWISTDKESYQTGDIMIVTGYSNYGTKLIEQNGNTLALISQGVPFKIEYTVGGRAFHYSGPESISITHRGETFATVTFIVDCSEFPDECKTRLNPIVETQIITNQTESVTAIEIKIATNPIIENNTSIELIIDPEIQPECGVGTELVNEYCKVTIKSMDNNFINWFTGLFF